MSPSKLRTAVVGVGYLGKFHADKYATLGSSNLVAVVDANARHGQTIADKHACLYLRDHRELIGKVDAVSIAVPTSVHYPIARDLLEAGMHVLVEKPITTMLEEADQLIQTAHRQNCVLQVGHLERFNAAILDADKILDRPRFIEAHRLAPFKPRTTDVNVILDLMIHDIDIILNVVGSNVVDIAANGTSVLSDSTDICNARLTFENGCVANITASRISMKSERKMRFFQGNACVKVDFQNRVLSHYYTGEEEVFPGVPNIASSEKCYKNDDALMAEIASFLECIHNNRPPIVSGEEGRRALDTAQRITHAIRGGDKR